MSVYSHGEQGKVVSEEMFEFTFGLDGPLKYERKMGQQDGSVVKVVTI